MIGAQRRGHGDQIGIRLFVLQRSSQLLRFDDAANQRVQVRLAEMGLALVDLVDDVGPRVDTHDFNALVGENGGRRQADIAKADDLNLTKLRHSSDSARCDPRSGRLHKG